MESGRTLHYKGNTLTPHIKDECKKTVKEHTEKVFDTHNGQRLKNPNKIKRKVVATLKCNWCDMDFKEYRTICPRCHNCQYCGFYSVSEYDCYKCGNIAPDDIRRKPKRIKLP